MTKQKNTSTPVNNPGKVAEPAEESITPTNNETGQYPSLSDIKELIEFVAKKGFNEFEFERGGLRLYWKTESETAQPPVRTQTSFQTNAQQPAGEHKQVDYASTAATAAQHAQLPEEKLHIVESPIVGTFYRSPSPTAEPFVKLGDKVEAGKTICIIEAMKLMNEIPSDASGTVAKIFVENGQPIEYGQALFGIKV